MITYRCNSCDRDLRASEFYVQKKSGKNYRDTTCKICRNAKSQDRYRAKCPPKPVPEEPDPIGPFDYTDGHTSFQGIDEGGRGMQLHIEAHVNRDEALGIRLPPEVIKAFQKWQGRLICLQEKG